MQPDKVILDTCEEVRVLRSAVLSICGNTDADAVQKDFIEMITQACEFASDLYEELYFSPHPTVNDVQPIFSKPIKKEYLRVDSIRDNLEKITLAYAALVFKIRHELLVLNQSVNLGTQVNKNYCTPFGFHGLLRNDCVVVYTLNYPAIKKQELV